MLRPEVTPETLMARQAGTLPGQFDMRVTSVTEGCLTAEMTVLPWMLAPNGFLHAASVILLADSCAGYATIAHLPAGARSFTTIELKSNHLGTARDGTLDCVAKIAHRGRTTQVWDATVTNEAGKKLALFRCTQLLLY